MKKAFIIVTVEGMEEDTARLTKQVKAWRDPTTTIYVVRNKRGVEGYAVGVNRGIAEARRGGCELIIVANPDIELGDLTPRVIREASRVFDVWGYAFKQNGTTYYRGVIDPTRLSGGLSTSKPRERYVDTEFVSGSLTCFYLDVIDRIGPWDEKYGMYYEDVDFSTRARAAGLRVGIDSVHQYIHHETSDSNPSKREAIARSRFRYFLKYANLKQTAYETARLPLTMFEYRGVIWNVIKTRPFLMNFLSLNASSLINKLLNFVLFIALVRVLSVGDYGLYTLLWAHIGLLMPWADAGTTTYGIMQMSKKGSSFADLYSFRLAAAIIVAAAAVIGGYAIGIRDMSSIFMIVSVMIANCFSGSLLIYLTGRNKSYLTSVISVVFNTVLIAATVAALIVVRDVHFMVVVIGVCYLIYALATAGMLMARDRAIRFVMNIPQWRAIARDSSIFLALSFFAGIYFKIDVYVLQLLKGTVAVGIYSAGYKFFEALLFVASSYTIAAAPIQQRLLAEDPHKSRERLRRDSKFLLIVGLTAALMLSILAPIILPPFLHGNYASSIPVFQIVILALPAMLVSTVYMSVLFILKKTRYILGVFTAQAIFNIVMNLLFVPRYTYIASSYLTVLAEVINVVVVMVLVKKVYANLS